MFHCEAHPIRTHDLLEIDAKQLISSQASAPHWVEKDLPKSPFVVVRRGLTSGHEIPIGVRGTQRNQRWAAFCHSKLVKSVFTPSQLLTRAIPTSRANAIPALRALDVLKERWMDFVLPWGPGGSVGFELASGRHVVTPESDLDIVIYAERRMTAEEAKSLCDCTMNLPAVVDIRVETPVCGFSLRELASQSPAAILLRTPSGIVLGRDPWGDEIGSMDPNYAAAKSVLPTRDGGRFRKDECRRTDVQMNRRKGAAK
jgi:phosphoribosyl-dephospho-CoA transferase